jgi:hypothetical protein
LNPSRSSKGFNPTELISCIISQEIYFFSVFTGNFLELRIWEINRSKEEIQQLKERPLNIVFKEINDVTFKMKTDKDNKRDSLGRIIRHTQ